MFPQKTKWFRRPIGWQDLGVVNEEYAIRNGVDIIIRKLH
jgi:hypothetical protein